MSSIDELFDRYRAAFLAGEDSDPQPYLQQVRGTDRRELQALIAGFLERAPAPAFDLARAQADPVTARVVANLAAPENWAVLLPAARERAQITRDELVTRLAEDLGVADRREKVKLRYHEMEQGLLEPSGVQLRVLETLSRIVGVSVERLRAAGRRLAPPAGGSAGPVVFARSAPAPPASPGTVVESLDSPPDETRDEVDELFGT